MNNPDVVIVPCPPYPEYETPLKDQSQCELYDCPKCNNKMWLSDKKKGMLMFASCLNKEIILGCYDCIKKVVEENPHILSDVTEVNLS